MAKTIEGLFYSESHEWVKVDGETAIIGISDHAQQAMGNIVYVDMPEEEDEVTADEDFGAVESVKAASHYCQMSVFPVELLKTTAHLHFRHSVGQVVVAIEDDAARHVGIQVVEPVNADALQHLAYVGSSMRKIRKSHSHKS